MQVLIGDLTAEQFARFIGVVLGAVIGFSLFCWLVAALIHSILDGWLFRKGALYYSSLRYLNRYFKRLKNCGTVENLDKAYGELFVIISLLQFQRVIPMAIILPLKEKLVITYNKRKVEISDYWSDLNGMR